jgi:hypothetical protein
MVVAWRIARLMRLGRTCPELNAQLMFEPDEWKAAFILKQRSPPDTPPTLSEVVRLVARLGGFLAHGRWRAGRENHLAGHAAHSGLRRWRQVLTRASGGRELCITKWV